MKIFKNKLPSGVQNTHQHKFMYYLATPHAKTNIKHRELDPEKIK